MLRKLFLLMGVLLIIFSIQSFGQDSTIKSLHPKMDKYYPRPQKQVVREFPVPTKPVTQASSAPVMANGPVSNDNLVSPAPKVEPNAPAPVEPQIETAPAMTSTPVTVENSNTNLNPSNTVTTPSAVTVTAPAPKVVPKPKTPPPPPYMDTRLGSSSPQYNTWEKNNNGAGSVTTNSK
jgi:hypothetical protein